MKFKVILKVYDVLGNEIVMPVNEEKPVGIYEVEFSSCLIHQTNGGPLQSGVYIYSLQSGSFVETKKMLILN